VNQFPYENLSDDEFENLVIRVAKEVLGVGCKTFSLGKDGAKDSWFKGTAEKFPSKTSLWSGTFNIQAKHTKTLNASCADNEFLVNKTSILAKEITRLKEVQVETPFDCYLLFTNRKLPGGIHPVIVKQLQDGLGIQNVEIIGREQIDTYLTDSPFIAEQFGLYKFIAPLRFYEKDLREIIIVFSERTKIISQIAADYIITYDLIAKEEKNKLNNLSKEYFDFLLSHSNLYFKDIDQFLTDPKNDRYTRMYSNTVSDLQAKILLERNRFAEFQFLIEHLVDFVVDSNQDKLRDIRSLVRVFVHFMYFNCDLGRTK
jgi:hypothetical protein